MDFPITIDRDACANLPGIESGTYLVSVDDSAISVYFGDRFEADIALSAVASAQPMDDGPVGRRRASLATSSCARLWQAGGPPY